MLLSTLKKIKNTFYKKEPSIITSHSQHTPKGRVLFSYLSQPILWKDHDERFLFHSNYWESKIIVKLFNEFGFDVDCIEWSDMIFVPDKHYDIFFDISANLQRLAPFMPPETLKILYLTGSYPFFQMQEEYKRITNLEQRKNKLYSPKRTSPHLGFINKSLEIANECFLIGNEHTQKTYPCTIQSKILRTKVSTSFLPYIKNEEAYLPNKKNFLWFYSQGAVHKGLDLLIDIFRKRPDLNLHIIGNVHQEKDFINIYNQELYNMPNIIYHGPLSPSSEKFIKIINTIFCFIAPSCSEAISTATATCMLIGLYPIISLNNGIDLPKSVGTMLYTCSQEEINNAINDVLNLSDHEIKKQIKQSQEYAQNNFSRESFTQNIKETLHAILIKYKKI